jgi:hypothetical protein
MRDHLDMADRIAHDKASERRRMVRSNNRAALAWREDDMYNGWLADGWEDVHVHRLSETQQALCHRLGISMAEYVRQLCREQCGAGGGQR